MPVRSFMLARSAEMLIGWLRSSGSACAPDANDSSRVVSSTERLICMICTFHLGQQFNPLFVKKYLHSAALGVVPVACHLDRQIGMGVIAWRVKCQLFGQHDGGTARGRIIVKLNIPCKYYALL